MTTLHDIYSRVANDINDVSFNLVSKGEYFLIAGQVALYLSRYVDLFVREIAYKATDEVSKFVVPFRLAAVENVIDGIDLVTQPVGDHYKVNRLLKVVRHNQDCREVSWQSIESASRGNAAFKTNATQLDYRFYATRVLPDGNLELNWVVPIAKDETVTVFALCDFLPEPNYSTSILATSIHTPKWSQFKDYTPIPDLLVQTFHSHLLVEVFYLLINRKGDEYANRLMLAKERAKRDLFELRKYITNLKSKDSFPQIQPFRWLSEDEAVAYRNDANIPAEWSSTIIM